MGKIKDLWIKFKCRDSIRREYAADHEDWIEDGFDSELPERINGKFWHLECGRFVFDSDAEHTERVAEHAREMEAEALAS